MDAIRRDLILQRWKVIQHELLPELRSELGALTPKLEKVIHTLEWVRIEEFVASSRPGVGRPPCERAWLANAFVAKAVLGLATTAGLIERLTIDRALRRICGFAPCRKLPSEATFSRAFEEFAQGRLAERVHEALIEAHLAEELIGHLSRDGTAIAVRERPARAQADKDGNEAALQTQRALLPAGEPARQSAPHKRKRGRPRRGKAPRGAEKRTVSRQRGQTLAQMLEEIPTACDRGTKCNAQGYKVSWNGYKLHVDTADFNCVQRAAPVVMTKALTFFAGTALKDVEAGNRASPRWCESVCCCPSSAGSSGQVNARHQFFGLLWSCLLD